MAQNFYLQRLKQDKCKNIAESYLVNGKTMIIRHYVNAMAKLHMGQYIGLLALRGLICISQLVCGMGMDDVFKICFLKTHCSKSNDYSLVAFFMLNYSCIRQY